MAHIHCNFSTLYVQTKIEVAVNTSSFPRRIRSQKCRKRMYLNYNNRFNTWKCGNDLKYTRKQ